MEDHQKPRLQSISAAMYAATVTGFVLWTIFGFLKGEWPIIVTNSVCCALSAFILAMKLMPARKREEVAEAIDPAG